MAMAMASALKGLSSVSKEELAKAKAMLKGKMFRQADDDSELMQDMGQQILLTGKYGSAAEFGKIIDSVTEADVTAAAKKILGSKLSLAAYGDVHSVELAMSGFGLGLKEFYPGILLHFMSMEGSLKEVDILLKNQLGSQQLAPESMEERCAQMREEILRMQKSREKIEARAQSIAELIQEEKLEHEAQLQSFEKDLSQSLKTLNKGLEDSVATSMNLMKVKVVETEKVLKTLIKQLNSSYAPALNEAEVNGSGKAQGPGPDALKGAMQRLLEEHDQLVQQQNDLLNRRQPLAQSVRAPPVPMPSAVSTTTAGAPIRWTAPANTSTGAQPPIFPGAASPPSPRCVGTPPLGEASPGVPHLCASPKHAGRAIQVAASPRPAAISPQGSPARSPTRGGSLTNLAMAFGAPGGANSPMRAAGASNSPLRPAQAPSFQIPAEPARSSAVRAMSPSLVREMVSVSPKDSPKDSPKATPKSTPKSAASRSPKGSQSPTAKVMQASPSGNNLMAVFVDMQTGEELSTKRSLYSI
ncbi:pep [Symbiodinium sp. CCMP2592]|nr:pep [Symbiodinium sp. CCMP2592]